MDKQQLALEIIRLGQERVSQDIYDKAANVLLRNLDEPQRIEHDSSYEQPVIDHSHMEVPSMWILSTAHLSEKVQFLFQHDMSIPDPLVVYEKDNYGWFLTYDPEIFEEGLNTFEDIPYSLKIILQLAHHHDILWLCFDKDGGLVPELQTFHR